MGTPRSAQVASRENHALISIGRVPALFALVSYALLGTALCVSSRLGLGNEAYSVPKACVLGSAAPCAVWWVGRAREVRLTAFDACLALYLGHGLLSALGSSTWAMASVALVPEWS